MTRLPLIATALARATLRLSSRPDRAIARCVAPPAVRGHRGAAAAAGDPGKEDLAGRMADAKRAHRMHVLDQLRIAFDDDCQRRPAERRPSAAVDQRIGALRAHLGDERLLRIGGDVPRRGGRDLRRAPERLLGDVRAGAVTGGQEHQAGRVGVGLDADLVERLDAALAGRRQAAARRLRRRRTDQDELALADGSAVVDQALGGERLLGVGDVQEGGVDFAFAKRIEHGERRPGNEQEGDPGIGAEGLLQAACESRFDQRPVGAEPQRPRARLAWSPGRAPRRRPGSTRERREGGVG